MVTAHPRGLIFPFHEQISRSKALAPVMRLLPWCFSDGRRAPRYESLTSPETYCNR